MKNQKIKLTLLVLLGLVIIVYIINFFSRAVDELSNNPVKLEEKIPVDYMNLFNPKAQEKLVLQSAALFKLRSVIVDLIYNNEYDIELTKIMIKPDFHIRTDIIELYKEPKGTLPQTISSYDGNDFRVDYNGNSKDTASKIYLTLHGDSISTYHKNDNIVYYYSYLKNGYIQYKSEEIYEISIEAKKQFYFFDQKKPIIIMFLKKNNFLYFITLRSKNEKIALSPDLLYKLVQF